MRGRRVEDNAFLTSGSKVRQEGDHREATGIQMSRGMKNSTREGTLDLEAVWLPARLASLLDTWFKQSVPNKVAAECTL